MTIKSDRWITQMAREHGMIEPFEERQVRAGVISYGVSSYGYDIRVADEFKIFTSATGELTVVDPKNFDPKAFKDFQGDECIIPPNSFALARTVEYFRIPRDVLTICVGKSTYARCFRGDTQVALVDGTAPTLEEMARRAEDGEMFWGYSIGPNGRLIVTLLDAPRYIGRDALIEVVLDNNESVFCTPDHEWMLRDGRMVAADQLRPSDSLMPLYRQLARGYEAVYQPLNGHLYPTHRLADEWNLRHSISGPVQLSILTQRGDLRAIGQATSPQSPPPWARRAGRAGGLRCKRSPMLQHQGIGQRRNSYIYEAAPEPYRDHPDFDRCNSRPWNSPRTDIVHAFKGSRPQRNHKVATIREHSGDHDVFCLTVPEAGNFALEAGVFVSNCGIIVNVTPFEPEWEGFVTLEISNTTPLPAKIYANEGIAQVLFFQSDEPCDVSYRDKKGKYQNQQGLVLPKL
jgi:deoxycytidine triphosphate deaminase